MDKKKAKDYIIFPLDVPHVDEAKMLVDLLCEDVGMFKIGLELFIRSGPEFVRFVNQTGTAKVFLDLKLHDIPATVKGAMASIAALDVALTTVHCSENPEMVQAAVEGAEDRVGVLGVTVLTSVSSDHLKQAGFETTFSQNIKALVVKRAEAAKIAGCCGVVCSGQEALMVRKALGKSFTIVTPGIRPSWEAVSANDQKRITTPSQAVEMGSDYLVIGRPIRTAKDPIIAAKRVAEEIESAL